MSDVIILRDLGLTLKVDLPDFAENMASYEAKWMRLIDKEIFEMGFGVTSWLVHIKDGIVTPLNCAMFFSSEEAKRIDLGKTLNMNTRELMNDIYKRRAGEFYADRQD